MTKLTKTRKEKIVELFMAGESAQRIGYLYEQPVRAVEGVIRAAFKASRERVIELATKAACGMEDKQA